MDGGTGLLRGGRGPSDGQAQAGRGRQRGGLRVPPWRAGFKLFHAGASFTDSQTEAEEHANSRGLDTHAQARIYAASRYSHTAATAHVYFHTNGNSNARE